MTEIATIQPDANAALWRLADALAGATSIIPTAYRGKPADILIAGIDCIQKPIAATAMIAV